MSVAFRYLIRAREGLYRSGLLRTRRLHHPVVSVGNLTLGGTGKTPLVIALAELLQGKGFRPVVLSRGYKRQSGETLLAGASWKEAGDEPCLIARRLRNVPVVVGANRYEAGAFAEERQLGDIFILDDGFQHRRLYRDVDIVTIDPVEWAAGEHLLPTGRWREPKGAVQRAHAACVQESHGTETPDLPIPSFIVRTQIDGLYRNDQPTPVESIAGRRVIAFAGIAKPERFFSLLESMGVTIARKVPFRDHHPFTNKEIEDLGGEILVTTEKDAVRLDGITAGNFLELRISAKIQDFDRLLEIILQRVGQKIP